MPRAAAGRPRARGAPGASAAEVFERRELLRLDLADFSASLGALRRQEVAAAEVLALRTAWPALVQADRDAKRAALQPRREIEDLEVAGEAPSAELVARLDDRSTRATQALRALEAARARARSLAAKADAVPEAARLLASMQPPPARAPASEFERLWAELLAAGVATPFSRSDFVDLQALVSLRELTCRGTHTRLLLHGGLRPLAD